MPQLPPKDAASGTTIVARSDATRGAVIDGGETTLKKLDNTTLQKPFNMLSYSVGHAAKIGAKKSYSKLLKKIDFSSWTFNGGGYWL